MKTQTVEKALEIATKAHEGQFRWSGRPYIEHPKAVARIVLANTDFERNGSTFNEMLECVALLHDVVEDTKITIQDLALIFPARVVHAVYLLTKIKNQKYLDYILAVKNNPLAREVKIADITHNLSDLDPEKKKDKYEKYILAKYILEN